jgi:hypothetical protein
MSYFWKEGIAIEVEADRYGNPEIIRWNGTRHRVESVANRWMIDDGWWQVEGRIWRTYYKVATHDGLLLILFQNVKEQDWFIQRLYD